MAQNQNRRAFLKAAGLTAASVQVLSGLPGCLVTPPARQAKVTKPNVILLMTDDQGYGDLGCHGNSLIQTPNIDKLYQQSVRLTNFHVAPTCSPTRAGLMTGRYCNRTGVWHTVMGRSLLRRDEATMADVFSANGYRTAIFGKWHLGDNYSYRPQDRGFQEVLTHGGGGVGQTPDYWGNDYSDDTYLHNGRPRKFSGYCTDVWFDGAIRFIEANRSRPFFVYLATNAPHGPFNVPEKYSSLYKDKDVPNAAFYGMITNIDENVGRLLRKLNALGLADNTILIFMTDNGTSAGFRDGKGFNAGMRGIKGSEYDGGHRVPCFIRWPAGGLAAGVNVDRLTAHIDLLPTLIGLCRLDEPKTIRFDGTSLVPLLRGRQTDWPDRVLIVDSQRVEHPEKWRKSAVMTDRWRLVNGKELYDMSVDAGQKNSVIDKHPDVAEVLRRAYEKWWDDVSERFNEYCEIVIGSDKENPTRLTCHDWHEGQPLSDQSDVLNARQANGFWAIEVARAGLYEISLRRWPLEVNAPVRAAVVGGRAVQAAKARLKVADVDLTRAICDEDTAVTFHLRLSVGKTRLQTWLIEQDGQSPGAYYVNVKRLTDETGL